MSDLRGRFWVRLITSAMFDAQKLWPRTRDRMEVRRHALKLRYWPESHPASESGQVLDVDWSWIKAMKGLRVGELRIDDTIGGHDNIRLIFHVADRKREEDPLPVVWILAAMQKKRDDFTKGNIATFRVRRLLVLERFYTT